MSDRYRDSYAGKSRSSDHRRGGGRYDNDRHPGPPGRGNYMRGEPIRPDMLRGDPYEFERGGPPPPPIDRDYGHERPEAGRFFREPSPRSMYPPRDFPPDHRGRRDDRMDPPYPPRDFPPRDLMDRGYGDREPPQRGFVEHRGRDSFEPFKHGRDGPPPRDMPREPYPPRRRDRSGSFDRKRRRSRSRSRERFPDAKREPFGGRDMPPPPREGSEIVENSIFISNLPIDVNVNELASLFGSIGVIQTDKRTGLFKIKLYYNPDGSCKGEASIYYQDSQAARAAIQWFNLSDLRGKKMTVQMTDRSYSTTRPAQRGGNFRGGPRRSGGDGDRGNTRERPSFAQPGDWTCTACKNTNFSWRTACNRCQAEKPPGEGGAEPRDYQGGYKRSPPRSGGPRGPPGKGRPY